jgi:hypothetical protein
MFQGFKSSHGAHCGTDCAWNVCPYFIPSRTLLADLPARSIAYPTFNGLCMYLCTQGSRGLPGSSGLYGVEMEARRNSTQNLLDKREQRSQHTMRCSTGAHKVQLVGRRKLNKSGPSTAAIRFCFEFSWLAGVVRCYILYSLSSLPTPLQERPSRNF